MNLLIINDEELTTDTMKADIPWTCYGIEEVFTAYDAEQAKDIILSKTVDIMLCDIEMPEMNGIELLRWVRGKELPIECIFLTCHPSFDYAQEAITLNCQDYILIPAKYEVIGEGVLKVVNRMEQQRQAMVYQEYGKRVVQEKINQAAETHGKKKSSKEIVEQIETYIQQNLGESDLSVSKLGSQFYMHPNSINRIYKEEKHISVSQYINEERMKLDLQLIKTGQLSMNAIAEQVGHNVYPHFCNAFKKYYGCSPTEYVKKKDKKNDV